MTIYLSVERDLKAAGAHKSSRYRCKIAANANGPSLFSSSRNAGSVAGAKRDAETLFDCEIAWRDVDDAVIRARAELEI